VEGEQAPQNDLNSCRGQTILMSVGKGRGSSTAMFVDVLKLEENNAKRCA